MGSDERSVGLKFNNIESLQSACELDAKISNVISRQTSLQSFSHIERLFDEANLRMKDGDEEKAFQLFSRMGAISRALISKSDFVKFKTTPHSRRFYYLFEQCLLHLITLDESLRKQYDGKENQVNHAVNQEDAISTHEVFIDSVKLDADFCSELMITPRELVGYVGEKHQVLIIDYRNDKTDILKHEDSELVLVARVPAKAIVPGCIGSSLIKSVAVSERGALQRMSDVDLVVLMGSEEVNFVGDAIPVATKEQILYNAVSTYNNVFPLRRSPVFLQGGFANWKLHYPMFSTIEYGHRKFTWNMKDRSEFALAVRQYKRELGEINFMDYPDLLRRTKRQAQAPKGGNDEVHSSSTSVDCTSNKDVNLENKEVDGRETSKASVRPSILEEPKSPPVVNRSVKPVQNVKEDVVPLPSELCANNFYEVGQHVLGGNQGKPGSDIINLQPLVPDRKKKPSFENIDFSRKLLALYDMVYTSIASTSTCGVVMPGFTGLKNLGNTCFMNAIFQVLCSNGFFRKTFTRDHFSSIVNRLNKRGTMGVISAVFSALMDSVRCGKFRSVSPRQFFDTFAGEVTDEFADYMQHDAQEFQFYLVNALHEDTDRVQNRIYYEQNYNGLDIFADALDFEKKIRNSESSPINDAFGFQTVSRLECNDCHVQSVSFELTTQLQIDVPNGRTPDLLDCISKHFASTTLDGPAKWQCPKCNRLRDATKFVNIWRLPEFLVIHLKRFTRIGGVCRKNNTLVRFTDESIDLSLTLHPYAQRSLGAHASYYKIYSIVNHCGSLNSGHYTAITFNDSVNQWLNFDDELVTTVNSSSVCSNKAYILYLRRKQSE